VQTQRLLEWLPSHYDEVASELNIGKDSRSVPYAAPSSYRDRKDYAMEAARLIKSKNPHSMVEVKDLQSGDVTAVAHRPE